jgi:hypothetical protein
MILGNRFSAKEDLPLLSPGYGFHLKENGQWKVEKIPPEVLKTAEFSGYLTVSGYESTVFNTPEGDSWAQKRTETPEEVKTAMGPDDLSIELVRIANLIDKSQRPSKKLVLSIISNLVHTLEPSHLKL